jgi:hypothetical protein
LKSTDISREASNRRRDIGSGEYWELLNQSFLELFLQDLTIKKKILGSFNESDLITWNEKYGIATIGSSERFSALVAKPESCAILNKFITKHGGVDSIKLKLLSPKSRTALQDQIIELFSTNVKLGRIKDYKAGNFFNNTARFIKDHLTRPGERSPRYRLVTEHTVGTGKTSGLLLVSSPQPVQAPVDNPSSNAFDKHSVVKKQSMVNGKRFSKTKMALQSYNDEEGKEVYVVNPYNEKLNESEKFINVDSSGRFDLYNASSKPVASALSVGGPQASIKTPTIKQHQWGTRQHSYTNEGTVDHPLGANSPSFFTPTPSVITSLYVTLSSLTENPAFLLGVISLMSSGQSNKYKYTQIKQTLPTKVIDNEEIEDTLLGDN